MKKKANTYETIKATNPPPKTPCPLRDLIKNAQERADQQPRKSRKPTGPNVRSIGERHH